MTFRNLGPAVTHNVAWYSGNMQNVPQAENTVRLWTQLDGEVDSSSTPTIFSGVPPIQQGDSKHDGK